MSATQQRLRKPISAAHIEVEMVFTSNSDFQKFGRVGWGRKSKSVSGQRWVSARWEDEEEAPEGGVIAVFQYVHTCRNEGAQRPDSERFFRAVCNEAGVSLDDAGVLDVRLLHRIKCVEPKPDAPAGAVVTPPTSAVTRKYGVSDRPYRTKVELDEESQRALDDLSAEHADYLAFFDFRD